METPSTSRNDSAPDRKVLLRGTLTNLAGIALRGSRIVFLWVIVAYCGPREYAVYSLSFAVYDVLLFLGLGGFDNSLWNFIPRYRERDPGAETASLRTAIGVPLVVSVVLGILLFSGADLLADQFFRKPEVGPGLRWMAAILIPATLARILLAATRALNIMKYYVIGIEFLEPVCMLAGLGALLIGVNPGLPRGMLPFAAHFAAECVVLVVSITFFARHFEIPRLLGMGRGWHGETFHYALALGGVNMAALMARRLDVFLVGRYLSLPQVGTYNLASDMAFILVKLRAAFIPVVTPIMADASSRGEIERLRNSAKTAALWSTAASLPILAVFAAFGPRILAEFKMDPDSGQAALMALSLGQFFSTITGPAGEVVATMGRPWIYTVSNCIPLLLLGMLGAGLIPRWGIPGAALLTSVGTVAGKIPLVAVSYATTRIHSFGRAQAEMLGAAALLAGVGYSSRVFWNDGSLWRLLTALGLFVLVLGGWIRRRDLLRRP